MVLILLIIALFISTPVHASSFSESKYTTVADEGTSLTKRKILNFAGAGVSCEDNSANGRTDCTISGGGGGGGTSTALDLADNGSNESSAITEIATTGDTNSIFTEPSADKLLITLSNDWPKADLSDALAANGANCSAGNYPLGIDASGAVESCTADDDVPDAGEVSDTALAAGAVDGGLAGEIADDSLTADDIGADAVSASELSGSGVEAELEGLMDLQDMQGAVTDAQVPDTITASNYQPLEATLTDIADGTITEDLVNTANPWADNEVSDTLTASTSTTASADDNDTSIATTAFVQQELNAAGGRSVTCASGSCDADAETYTEPVCFRITSPTGTDFQSAWVNRTGFTFTVSDLWCESDQTVNTMLQVDDGTPADMDSVDLACISTPDTDSALDGDATVANGDRVDIDVASVSGTPTWVSICMTGAYSD